MKNNNFKALALLTIITLGLAMPMMAQNDGFFRNNEELYNNRAEASGYIINQTFGQDPATPATGGITNQQFGVPVGSGLLIMVAAGAGYVMARRRRSMRKAGTMLLALAMVLTFTQCKKNAETIISTPSQKGTIFVTLKVENNSRHQVITSGEPYPGDLGKVVFESGDSLWVVNNNQVSGKLGYIGDDTFQGYIDNDPTGLWKSFFGGITMEPDDYLWFCYTSNRNPNIGTDEGFTPPYFIWNSEKQKDNLFVISFGRTSKTLGQLEADNELQNLSCFLENKCALVEFKLTTSTADDVLISGINTFARLDIKSFLASGAPVVGPSTYTGMTGFVRLFNPDAPNASTKRWGVLMTGTSIIGDAVVGNKLYENAANIGTLIDNALVYGADAIEIDNSGAGITLPASSFYSSDANGWIEVAKSNLKYDKGTNLYSFMTNAYDMVESGSSVATNYGTNGVVSLFGWGAWGRLSTAPYNTSSTSSDYTWSEFNNTISLGGKTGWRTMMSAEKDIIFKDSGPFNSGNGDEQNFYSGTIVNGNDEIHGIIVLPDIWSGGALPGNPDAGMNDWDNIEISTSDWATLENAGALFFPAAGYRSGTSLYNFGSKGSYWTSESDGEGNADVIWIDSGKNLYGNKQPYRVGCSVRLVRDI